MLVSHTDGDPPQRSVRISWELSLASIMHGVQVVALLCALVYWFVINAQRGAENERRLAEMQATFSQQLGDLRQSVTGGLNDMRQQLNSLPDTRARLDQAEHRFADSDAKNAAVDNRISALERQTIELRSDLNAVTRASNVPLPGARR
jgi:septal ring factor EnvC (AmiA/AmiB activator)